MSHSIFGWDLPPGVSTRDIDPPEQPCDMCGRFPDDCVCPECSTCGEVGNPHCYEAHGMRDTPEQEAGRRERRLQDEAEAQSDAEYAEELQAASTPTLKKEFPE